jgi:hypothetical protein
VIERLEQVKGRCYLFLCRCECGKEKTVHSANLYNQSTRSCGCLHTEINSSIHTTHGGKRSAEYRIWCGLKYRCNQPHSPAYKNYGARGIKVCPAWDASFAAFFHDMGLRPTSKHTLDRIDNERGYEAANCRWATRKEQADNTRRSRFLEFCGETKTMGEWCSELGLNRATLWKRLERGWSDEMALGYR